MAGNHAPIRGKPVEKVGVIVVHGIGDQGRFQHLETETRSVLDAILTKYGRHRRKVTPTLTTAAGDAHLGDQSSWVSGAKAPLHALAELPDKIVDIAFHECWWADLNETFTLAKQIRFWLWGLSLAGIATHHTQYLPGASATRLPSNYGKLTCFNRLRMGYVSVLFGFSAFSIALLNMLLTRLNFAPVLTSSVLVNYLSSVKLYSQDKRWGGGPMDGPDEPPRAAIRRRMIRVMMDVANAGYDRWYILAHSQGTIVAWNGLMETAQALPNYLDEECWNALATSPLRTAAASFNVKAMMPNRPVWLGDREIVDRDAFFKSFRGILTYGSPLERFCALWSAMVPLNSQEDPFQDGAEWINVYDPTDPVGTWLEDFDPLLAPPARPGHTKLKAHNFPCRASPILLLSHICYLTASRWSSLRLLCNDRDHVLVNFVADWLVQGGSLAARIAAAPRGRSSFWMPLAADGAEPFWQTRRRVFWRWVQWAIVGAALTALTLLSLRYIIWPLIQLWPALAELVQGILGGVMWLDMHVIWPLIGWLPYLKRLADASEPYSREVVLLWEVTVVIVCAAGLVNYVWSTRARRNLGTEMQARGKAN